MNNVIPFIMLEIVLNDWEKVKRAKLNLQVFQLIYRKDLFN